MLRRRTPSPSPLRRTPPLPAFALHLSLPAFALHLSFPLSALHRCSRTPSAPSPRPTPSVSIGAAGFAQAPLHLDLFFFLPEPLRHRHVPPSPSLPPVVDRARCQSATSLALRRRFTDLHHRTYSYFVDIAGNLDAVWTIPLQAVREGYRDASSLTTLEFCSVNI